MNTLAILLVVLSALVHASWNFLSKKSKNKLVFNWYIVLFGVIIYLPFFIYFFIKEKFLINGWIFIILSAIFHVIYFYFLGKSYGEGNLSLTYPIARSSPLFVPILAVMLIKERVSLVGISGIIIIIIGIYMLHLKSLNIKSFLEPMKYFKEKATIFALLTALFSAFYSINDKMGVKLVSPFLYIYLTWVLITIFYLPIIYSNKRDLREEWKLNWKTILLAGFLVILSYVLTLFAFKSALKASIAASLQRPSMSAPE